MGFKINRTFLIILGFLSIVSLDFNDSSIFAQSEQDPYLDNDQVLLVDAKNAQGQTDEPIDSQEPNSDEPEKEGIKIDKEKMSLDLKGIDILELFRVFSQKMGVTIVPTKAVSGRVNIYLNNLSFSDALDVVLISQDLAFERKDNIINVMTSSEYQQLYGKKFNEKRKFITVKLTYAKPSNVFNVLGQIKSDIGKVIADEASGTILLIDIPEKLQAMQETIVTLDKPFETQIFDIKYAKPADLKTQLTPEITSGTGALMVDERASKVVVSDLPDKMKKIKRIMRALDEPSKQVFIEAEILEITLKKEYQRGGINWEGVFAKLNGLDFLGTFPIAPSFTPSPLLSVANLKMSLGTVAKNKYTATMQLLETYGDTKVLSRPKIMAINNQEAKVLVGSREAFISATQSQSDVTVVTAENVQFIDVGVKLNVVPTINTDGFITMKIKPEVSSVRETLTTKSGTVVPIVNTSEAETTVKVKDGTMIMIAGLMKDERRNDNAGVPWVGRIPIISAFFGSRANLNKKTELIIFLTPKIVTGETPTHGEEPEKLIPKEVMPAEVLDRIVDQKISEGLDKQMQTLPIRRSRVDHFEQSDIATASKRPDDFVDKMKGMK